MINDLKTFILGLLENDDLHNIRRSDVVLECKFKYPNASKIQVVDAIRELISEYKIELCASELKLTNAYLSSPSASLEIKECGSK